MVSDYQLTGDPMISIDNKKKKLVKRRRGMATGRSARGGSGA
jgi:hypothetical protein